MKINISIPEKIYPYLAVWVGRDGVLDAKDVKNVLVKDILIISMVTPDGKSDKKTYVQKLIGGEQGYFTKNEEEYAALPNGFSLTITQ